MKKKLLILLSLPMIGISQDKTVFNKYDLMINQVLENTVSFIKQTNITNREFRFYKYHQKPIINWNEKKFSKWQIIDKKDKK